MDIYNDVGYINVPKDEECILTAVAVSKLVEVKHSTIRTWATLYEDFLYIKKINGRMVYTEASVNQFKFIRDLIKDKGFTHKQIYDHISKKGFEYAKYDSGLINPEDPLGYEALASQLMIKNQDMMKQFMAEFIKYQDKRDNERDESLITRINDEVATTVDERLDEKLEGFKSDLLQAVVDQKELEFQRKDTELLDNLKKHMEDQQKKYQEQNAKKSLWSRIFNK